jgi:hypothetical protein
MDSKTLVRVLLAASCLLAWVQVAQRPSVRTVRSAIAETLHLL